MTEQRCPGACGSLIPVALFACTTDWDRLPWPLRSNILFTAHAGASTELRAQARAAASTWYAENPRTRPL